MKLDALKEMIAARSGEYERMLAEKALARAAPDDRLAFEALGGLVNYKGAKTVPEIVELAEKAVISGPVRSEHIRAAIGHAYPMEAHSILQSAMRLG